MPFSKRRRPLEAAQRSDPEAARAAAIGLLARRDFASGELRAKLLSKGYAGEAVAEALSALAEERLLDDARYAENYVAAHFSRGQGPLRIAADLRAFGLSDALVDAALGAGGDWHTLAREVRSRKFGPEPPPDWAERARQARFLQYRGFSSDHIRSALGVVIDPDYYLEQTALPERSGRPPRFPRVFPRTRPHRRALELARAWQ
jgi:regulatory protein